MKKYSLMLGSLLMCATMTAQANVLTTSSNKFNDLGGSTIDESTGLEWRDFQLDITRSTCSVTKDAGGSIPRGCIAFDNLDLIANSDGWRLATRDETTKLLADWFGVTLTPGVEVFAPMALTSQFLNVFAGGKIFINPIFYPDIEANPAQAIGFYVGSGELFTGMLEGDINSVNYTGTTLVRETQSVSEPGELALLASALAALALTRRRKHTC